MYIYYGKHVEFVIELKNVYTKRAADLSLYSDIEFQFRDEIGEEAIIDLKLSSGDIVKDSPSTGNIKCIIKSSHFTEDVTTGLKYIGAIGTRVSDSEPEVLEATEKGLLVTQIDIRESPVT